MFMLRPSSAFTLLIFTSMSLVSVNVHLTKTDQRICCVFNAFDGVCLCITPFFNLMLVLYTSRGQEGLSVLLVSFRQVKAVCPAPHYKLIAHIHNLGLTNGIRSVCGCVCIQRAAGVKGRLFKLRSPNYANENRVHIGARQLSKNTDVDTI